MPRPHPEGELGADSVDTDSDAVFAPMLPGTSPTPDIEMDILPPPPLPAAPSPPPVIIGQDQMEPLASPVSTAGLTCTVPPEAAHQARSSHFQPPDPQSRPFPGKLCDFLETASPQTFVSTSSKPNLPTALRLTYRPIYTSRPTKSPLIRGSKQQASVELEGSVRAVPKSCALAEPRLYDPSCEDMTSIFFLFLRCLGPRDVREEQASDWRTIQHGR
ncbi:hypothetical protein DXG01_003932 [Tephrocybe rancida]|nr:hypothetical protein DXG01_003932 [Tephrocybe rancida]